MDRHNYAIVRLCQNGNHLLENLFGEMFSHFGRGKFCEKLSRVTNHLQEYPVPRGTPKSFLVKYIMGIPIIAAIIILVLLPLIIYALAGRVGTQSYAQRIDLTVSLEGYTVNFVSFGKLIHSFSAFLQNDRTGR